VVAFYFAGRPSKEFLVLITVFKAVKVQHRSNMNPNLKDYLLIVRRRFLIPSYDAGIGT